MMWTEELWCIIEGVQRERIYLFESNPRVPTISSSSVPCDDGHTRGGGEKERERTRKFTFSHTWGYAIYICCCGGSSAGMLCVQAMLSSMVWAIIRFRAEWSSSARIFMSRNNGGPQPTENWGKHKLLYNRRGIKWKSRKRKKKTLLIIKISDCYIARKM